MTQILLAIVLGFAGFVEPPAISQEHGHEAAPAAHAASGEHDTAPLLPSNLEEAKEYFLAPAIWTLVIFVLLLAILYPMAWKPVLAGLKKREGRIRADIAEAEAARKKAEATLREYNTQLAAAEARVRQMISDATAQGEKLATGIRMQAVQEAEEAKERAQRDIEAARDAAIRDFRAYAADLAIDIAGKILRRNVNAADQQDLVRQSLDELQTVGKG
jgi:F-type H+-transporting ATPase subunit b